MFEDDGYSNSNVEKKYRNELIFLARDPKVLKTFTQKTQETTCNHIDQIFMRQYKSSLLIPYHGCFINITKLNVLVQYMNSTCLIF